MGMQTFEQLVAPSRVERYEEVLKSIQDAAVRRKVPFTWKKSAGIEQKVNCPATAKVCNIRGSYQNLKGEWVVKRVPFTVTHGDLMESGMKPLAKLEAKYKDNDKTKGVEIVQIQRTGVVSNKDYAKYEKKVLALANNWNPYCNHCNQDGDRRRRDNLTLLAVTAPTKTIKSRKGNVTFKEGDIVQLGSGCMKKYLDIDPETLSKMYELERVKRVGRSAAPQDQSGYGWKTMDIIDFLQRAVMFYGYRAKDYLGRRGLSRQPAGEEAARKLYSAKSEKFVGRYGRTDKGTGVFPARKGMRVMQGRIFRFRDETYMQPYKLKLWGADAMVRAYDDAIAAGVTSDMAVEVPLLDSTGAPELDEKGDPIFTLVPNIDKIPQRVIFKSFDRVLPYSEEVVTLANDIRKWVLKLNPATWTGQSDLIKNWKEILKYGFVGDKTANTAAEMWKEYMIATYDKRREEAILVYQEEQKKLKEEFAKFAIPDGKWFDISKLNGQMVNNFVQTDLEYRKVVKYKGRRQYVNNVCHDRNAGLLWATQANYDKLLEMQKERDEKSKREQEARVIYDKKSSDSGRRYPNSQGLNEETIRKILGWESYTQETIDLLLSTNWRGDEIRYIFMTPDENDLYVANLPTPATPTATPTFLPPIVAVGMAKEPKISQAEAKRKSQNSKKTSTHQGNIGDTINISGYVTFVSRPFRNRKMGSGQTIQLVSDAGNVYVIFWYSSNKPTVGDYIGLEDYDITAHSDYYGMKQTVVNKSGQPYQDLTL